MFSEPSTVSDNLTLASKNRVGNFSQFQQHPFSNFSKQVLDPIRDNEGTFEKSAPDDPFQALYEAYGKRTVETGNTLDRQKANTKDEDPTGLLDEGWRYRDLDTGVFLTRDPIGFKDGPNMYTYVKQNPWSMFDPEGLDGKRTATPPPPPKRTGNEWHHDLPQQYRKQFEKAGIDIDEGKYGRFLKADKHQELHNEGKYNEDWGKFFEDHKADFKGMEPSQQKEMIESHLSTLKSDEKFAQILQSGSAVPKDLNYGTYRDLTGIEKSGVIAGSYAAKSLGVVAEWGGKGLKAVGDIPFAKEGVAVGVFGMSYADARAQGDNIPAATAYATIDAVNPVPVGARETVTGVNKAFVEANKGIFALAADQSR